MFESYFHLKSNQTTVKTEIIAGLTTFLTMAYILAVNPAILGKTGMDTGAVFTATALSSIVATLIMAFYAKLPFALAPGMGLNAFFAFTIVLGMGYSWQFALTAVFLEGIIFILLTFFKIRELIVDAIPIGIKHSISAGIGLFIAFIGLHSAGIVVPSKTTMVTLGSMNNPVVWISVSGLIVSAVFLARKVKGALLYGIFIATLIAIPLGVTHLPGKSLINLPPSIGPVFFKMKWDHIFTVDMLIILFTLLFVDMFDTVGTLVGVASKAGLLGKNGSFPRINKALMADAVGTTIGGMLGTSTVTAYVESAAGITEGGKTGLTAFFTAMFFVIALFFAPVFLMVPAAATAPALILVGSFMMSPVKNIKLNEFSESIPAFLTMIIMPLTYSIANGIAFGMIAYVLIKLLAGKHKEISIMMYILAALFVLKFIF